MIKNKLYIFILLLPITLNGEINYSHSGYGIATTVNRLSDGSIIKLPYRMLTYETTLNYNNFNLITSSALEFHLKNQIKKSKLNIDFREIYLEWLTPLADFTLGKQIISWGAVSENNPTDNISPYNYYYLFSIGKERKQGILSFSSNIYLNDIRLNTIFIPKHSPNLLPLNDPEFAISSPIIPKDEQIMDLKESYEYGLSLNIPINYIDLTFSYFSGYDKIVSLFGANVWSNQAFTTITADTVLSYRKTDVWGLGYSALIGDFAFKTDLGLFNTYDNIKNKNELKRPYDSGTQLIIDDCLEKNAELPAWSTEKKDCNNEPVLKEILKLDNSANYYQYNFEIEFSPISDLRIITQYLKQENISFGKADSLTLSTETVLLDPEELFISGLGAPNTFISTNSLTVLVQKQFPDKNIELRYTGLFDLDSHGVLNELGIEYKINSSTNLLIALNKIIADNDIDMNPFSSMENFSHFRMELKYYY